MSVRRGAGGGRGRESRESCRVADVGDDRKIRRDQDDLNRWATGRAQAAAICGAGQRQCKRHGAGERFARGRRRGVEQGSGVTLAVGVRFARSVIFPRRRRGRGDGAGFRGAKLAEEPGSSLRQEKGGRLGGRRRRRRPEGPCTDPLLG